MSRRVEKLHEALELMSEVRWGLPGYEARVDEMTGSYPGGGSNEGSSPGSVSNPTFAAHGKRDPGREELSGFDKELERLYSSAFKLHARWDNEREPKTAPAKIDDPGCEPCTSIPAELPNGAPGYPDNWSASYCLVDEVVKAATKSRPAETKRVRVCYWCYRFSLTREQGGAGRLPNVYELVAHIEGRRVMRSA